MSYNPRLCLPLLSEDTWNALLHYVEHKEKELYHRIILQREDHEIHRLQGQAQAFNEIRQLKDKIKAELKK